MQDIINNYKPINRIVLKLGGLCNLKCKHCHCTQSVFEYNPDIIPFIKNFDTQVLRFSGGEPLLYWDIIQKVIEELPSNIVFNIVTNGTKLTKAHVDYLNKHHVGLTFSYDGENDSRDNSLRQNWADYFKADYRGLSILYSESNEDIAKLKFELDSLMNRFNHPRGNFWYNFPHQTDYNANSQISLDLAKKYCAIMAQNLELAIREYAKYKTDSGCLFMAINKWLKPIYGRGVKCCNEHCLPLTIDGRFMLCPYGTDFVGDIYTGVDWDKVESFLPEKCKTCAIKNECANTCIANISEKECFISKVMNKHLHKLINKYGLDLYELYEFSKVKSRKDKI